MKSIRGLPSPPYCFWRGQSVRESAAFLQNAPVVYRTRGFTPGWYAAPRWGTPNAPPPQSPHASTATHLVNDDYFFSWATITTPLRDRLPSNPAAAGPGRSEHRNVDTLIPLARQRESPAGPNVPCERRTVPAEPPSRHRSPAPAPAPAPALSPGNRPRQSATAPRGYKAPHRCTCLSGPSDLEKQRGLNPMERIFGQVFQDDQKTEGSSRRPDPKKQQRALG